MRNACISCLPKKDVAGLRCQGRQCSKKLASGSVVCHFCLKELEVLQLENPNDAGYRADLSLLSIFFYHFQSFSVVLVERIFFGVQ